MCEILAVQFTFDDPQAIILAQQVQTDFNNGMLVFHQPGFTVVTLSIQQPFSTTGSMVTTSGTTQGASSVGSTSANANVVATSNSNNKVGIIAGVVVAFLAILSAALLAFALIWRRCNRTKAKDNVQADLKREPSTVEMQAPRMKDQSSIALIYGQQPIAETSIPELTNVQVRKKLEGGNLNHPTLVTLSKR